MNISRLDNHADKNCLKNSLILEEKNYYSLRLTLLYGWIVTSSRLGVSARCLRDGETPLQIFPFDVHTCNLTFGSFGYEDFEFIYKWTDDKIFIETEGSIKKAFDIDSARQSFEVKNEFKLYNISYAEQTLVTINGRRSMLVVCFHD